MSIDRIGKGPGAVPPGATGNVSSASSRRPFSVDEARPAQASDQVTGAAAASPAEQVRRGEMTIDAYLDLRVNEATRHLKVGPADLARIQGALREQLAHDPALQELVQSATGKLPPADDE